MGYTTDFYGEFDILPFLRPEHREYLTKFSETRRMTHDPVIASGRPDPAREAVGLPIGPNGAYFVGEEGFRGQGDQGPKTQSSVVDYNMPPIDQPSLWCQWIPDDDGSHLRWDGGEKFYEYIDWLAYLIEHFLGPWGYSLAGEVEWQGEEPDDRGRIVITSPSNSIQIFNADITWSKTTTIVPQNKR